MTPKPFAHPRTDTPEVKEMDLLAQTRQKIREQLDARSARQAELDALLVAPTTEARDLNDSEAAKLAEIREAIAAIDALTAELTQRETDLADAEARKADAAALALRLGEKPSEVPAGGARSTSRPVYGPDSSHSFLGDAWRARSGFDLNASQRLAAHSEYEIAEARKAGTLPESRDVGTSAFGALVVPQYLTDLYAPLPRAGRPFANTVREVPLPDEGMTVSIPRITTGTATAAQATENSAVQETDIDETTLTVNVRTIAGQQDVSRQSLDRGRMVEPIVFGDLHGSYDSVLDSQLISSDGTSGTLLGALNVSSIGSVAYTDASPTVAEFWPKLADAIQTVNSNRYQPATVVVMHPRRWGWLKAALDSGGRPVLVDSGDGPQNAMGVGKAAEYGQVVGQIQGLPVVTDANVPTNLGGGTEDVVLVVKADDLVLMEDAGPKQLRFEETTGGSLTVKLVLFNYVAYAAGRTPSSICKIAGTGLAAPTF